ncbi:MAG: 4-hydroxy-3-methylbut-2-enyl diphosphate reductase [Bacillota bacterium]|nr:4-hydroxy-3-methylbut-2-enyl diphosphate reductase [Bacillota bacterium]
MRVLPITPRGYCHGVVSAISVVNQCLADMSVPRPIHLLGMIVHNRFVVERFAAQGVIVLDSFQKSRLQLLDGISSGTVVVTAHGVGDDVYAKITAKKLHLVDATCRDVRRTHDEIKERIARGDAVLFVGKQGHPETEGVLAIPGVLLIENLDQARTLPFPAAPLFIANQTTFSIKDIVPIVEAIQKRRPDAESGAEICDATRRRQEAVASDAVGVDLLLVVGDPHSNNTNNLVRIGRDVAGVHTERIESSADIEPAWLEGIASVAVTSGASTPTDVTAAVIAFLRHYDECGVPDIGKSCDSR